MSDTSPLTPTPSDEAGSLGTKIGQSLPALPAKLPATSWMETLRRSAMVFFVVTVFGLAANAAEIHGFVEDLLGVEQIEPRIKAVQDVRATADAVINPTVAAIEDEFDSISPSYDDLRVAIADGKMTRQEARWARQTSTADHLERTPQTARQVKTILEALDRAVACDANVCDRKALTKAFAVDACQANVEFAAFMDRERRKLGAYLRELRQFTASLDCEAILRSGLPA